MATSIIVLSKMNPVKFVELGYTNPAPYNTRYFDDWIYGDTLRDFEEQIGHLQPWQNNDIIFCQLLSNISSFNLQLERCDGHVFDNFTMTHKPASTELSGLKAYEFAYALTLVPEGVYRFVLRAGSPTVKTLVSEWLHVKSLHDNSFLIRYRHDRNDYDTSFETGIEFRLRCLGGRAEYKPAVDRTVFVDHERDAFNLDAKPFATEKWYFGDGYGIPDWMAERINYANVCSHVLYDGKQYVAVDSMEENREQNYPLAGWSLEVRRADQRDSIRFDAENDEEGPITTLVYNIDSRGFGPDSSPGSDNTIQVISTD